MTYNGDNFDFPYIAKRCEVLGLDLKKETGFGATSDAQSTHFLSTCCTHIDAIHWVRPRRSHLLPATTATTTTTTSSSSSTATTATHPSSPTPPLR